MPECYFFGMSATTVKLEDGMLREISRVKPPEQSLSAFVRGVLERDLRRRKMREAAHAYQTLLAENENERSEVAAWETANLTAPPKPKRKSK